MPPTFAQHFKAGATLVHAIYTIDKIYEDDKLDWDDAPAIGRFIGGELLMWGGDILEWRNVGKKPLYIIEAAILAGGVASYAIAGRSGLVSYTEFVTEPKHYTPSGLGSSIAKSVETIYEHKIEKPLTRLAKKYVGWVDRRAEDVKLVWSITAPRPLLPF